MKPSLTTIIMIINTLIVAYVIFLVFAPVQTPIYHNAPFPTDKQVVQRGEQISYFVEMTKRAEYEATLNRNIVCNDGNLVTMAPGSSALPIGNHAVWVTVTVPEKTSIGTCHLEMYNVFTVNPLRTETMEVRTQDFKVVDKSN